MAFERTDNRGSEASWPGPASITLGLFSLASYPCCMIVFPLSLTLALVLALSGLLSGVVARKAHPDDVDRRFTANLGVAINLVSLLILTIVLVITLLGAGMLGGLMAL